MMNGCCTSPASLMGLVGVVSLSAALSVPPLLLDQ